MLGKCILEWGSDASHLKRGWCLTSQEIIARTSNWPFSDTILFLGTFIRSGWTIITKNLAISNQLTSVRIQVRLPCEIETILFTLIDGLWWNQDRGIWLVLMGLSAAFDIIYHALHCVSSFLNGQFQLVMMSEGRSLFSHFLFTIWSLLSRSVTSM